MLTDPNCPRSSGLLARCDIEKKVTKGESRLSFGYNADRLCLHKTVNGRSFAAEYDGNGNIVSILDSAEGRTEYEYDALNQLTKVTYPDGTEYSYVYDAGGNLTQWNKNGMTLHIAHYATTGWKDQFVYLDGTGIQYDEIGNPKKWRLGVNLTWEAGRRLSTLQKGKTSVSYTYNAEGTRIGKTVNGQSMSYLWDGGKLLSQTSGSDTQVFLYHGDSRVAVEFMGQLYYYVYNLQGDVVEPGGQDRDDDGNVQVRRVGEAGEHDRPHGNDAGCCQPVPLPGILLRYRIRVLLSPEPVL